METLINHYQQIQQEGYSIVRELIGNREVESLLLKLKALKKDNIKISSKILYTHKIKEDLAPMNEILTQWLNPCKKGIVYDTSNASNHFLCNKVNSGTSIQDLLQ